jgi:hypothetical protein
MLIAAMAITFGNLSVANAWPLNPSPFDASSPENDISGFLQYWDDLWNEFKDHYSGPLAMNTLWAAFLTSLYVLITFCDRRK